MTEKSRQSLIDEMRSMRDAMQATLKTLKEAKNQSEQRLNELKRPDTLQSVTGKSALDNAIAQTQRMIETLDRSIHQCG